MSNPQQVLSRPVQVFDAHGDRGHVQLPAGEPVPEWAEGLVTNPKAFQPVEEEVTAEAAFDRDLGTGPFERRRREQLINVAKQFNVGVDASKGGDTKQEIIKALERAGIEAETVPDEDR